MSTYTDESLLDLTGGGNHSAFSEIYSRYWDRLYATAFHHLNDTAAAEETVQDVFVTLWQRREQLQITQLSAYLSAMTRHAVYRRMAKTKQVRDLHEQAQALQPEAAAAQDFEHRQLLAIVEKLSCGLPEKCRLVFRANKLYGQPIPEVAREMKISTKTAEAHLTKALKMIRLGLGKALHCLVLFF